MSQETAYNQQLSENLGLAKGKWFHLCESLLKNGHTEKAAMTARLLENEAKYMECLEEDVKMLNVGSFDRFAFPMIRAVYPNLIATDLVSVQPMQGPTSLIFYMDTRFSNTKGSAVAGATALSPIDGHAPFTAFSSELIDAERVGTGDGADDTPTIATFDWLPVRPNSVRITAGSVVAVDDGNGGLSGTGIDSGTINYQTGAVVLNYTAAPALNAPIVASYRYIMEANAQRPELDIILSSAQVQADTYTLNTNWSVEAEQDFRAVHGIEAQTTLMSQVAEQLRYEIDRSIIADLETIATAGPLVTWDYTPPTGVPYYQHQLTFINKLVEAGNIIFRATRGKAQGNWIVVGTNLANVIESLPGFVGADYGDAEGVVYIGQLGHYRLYKDPWMATDYGVLGHKGSTWLKAGYAYCPYVPLWRTPVVTLTDYKRRVGLMTRYAKKAINTNFYVKLFVDNYGVLN